MLLAALKESLRRVRRSPRLSIAVVLCIALGMAATASVATLVSLTSYRALPFPDAERLVRIWNIEQGSDEHDALAWIDFRDLQAGMDTLGRLEAATRTRLIWYRQGQAGRRVEGEAVSNGYFDLLDVNPYLGRTFTDAEFTAGEPVMLLAYTTWAREFAYAEDIVGRSLRTSISSTGAPRAYTIIGVLPPDFYGTIETDMPEMEFWVPVNSYLSPQVRQDREAARNTWVVGRLAEGASLSAARAEAAALAEALSPEYATFSEGHEFVVERFGENWRAGFSEANTLLAGAATLLLAVAVLNVAMLLAARTMERRHELGVRAALGARRRQLVVPVLGETLALAVAGGVIGLVLAGPLLEAFLSMSGAEIPSYFDIAPDLGTLGITFVLMLLAGTGAALLPAWAAAKVHVNDVLREGSSKLAGSRTASKWGHWMVGGQIALTLSLLLAGALLGRSYLALESQDLGFATDNRLRLALFVNPADVADESALPSFVDRVEDALMAEPGVENVAFVWPTVPMPSAPTGRLLWAGMPEGQRDPGLRVANFIVDEGFFGSLDIPLVSGRTFDSRDAGADVRSAIIGRSVAEQLGGPAAALDREVRFDGEEYRVVGVVADTMFGGPQQGADFRHQFYRAYTHAPRRLVSPIVRVSGDPASYAGTLRQTLTRVAPSSAVDWVDPVNQALRARYRDSAFRLALISAFAISALLLAAVGLYAILAQQVTATTAEIGIRKAMGATDARVLRRVLGRGIALALAGTGAGLVLSLAVGRVMGGLLHGIGSVDFLAYFASAGILLLIALIACALPARRAARIAPMEALRHE